MEITKLALILRRTPLHVPHNRVYVPYNVFTLLLALCNTGQKIVYFQRQHHSDFLNYSLTIFFFFYFYPLLYLFLSLYAYTGNPFSFPWETRKTTHNSLNTRSVDLVRLHHHLSAPILRICTLLSF